ncbi:type II and III secretion system protein family protein [Edaphobacter bradus]|uniref:type II and III secretion system protein family protein n=1 Tax=Edaphobacter bradus TaxID=2259016 RepID=UPI0021E0DB6E|nr:pilus assembly protein N-terminal domain-containing protein [Edaphobacter bradus]
MIFLFTVFALAFLNLASVAQTTNSSPQAPPASPGVPSAPESETVHVLVGRSIVVNMQVRLRRIYVSNPAVVETSTTTPNQVVVTAKAPGASNVVFWDEFGNSKLLELYADIDVTGLRDAVQDEFPGQAIQVRAEQGRIILSGTARDKETMDSITKMAQTYSKDVVDAMLLSEPPHARQIMLKVRFAEVDRTKLQNFGINIFSTGAANTIGTITTQQFGSTTLNTPPTGTIGGSAAGTSTAFSLGNLLNIFLFRPDLNLGATISDLQQHNILQLLAEPNLLAMSGSPAHFLAGGEFPYPVVQGGGAGGFTAVTIQFRPFGVRLDFTGIIQPDGSVRMKVAPEVSSLDYANSVTISGFTVPAISTRRAETEIQLKDGQSFGIAGLMNSTTTAQMSKIPGIADVPILGQLFHSKSDNNAHSELMVIVTPTVVDPLQGNPPPPTDPKLAEKLLDSKQFDKEAHRRW